jgi:hypothetical protein
MDARTPFLGDQPVATPLSVQDNTQNKLGQISVPRVGFEPMIPVFEVAKTALPLWSARRLNCVVGSKSVSRIYVYNGRVFSRSVLSKTRIKLHKVQQ